MYDWSKPLKDNNKNILFLGLDRYLFDYLLENYQDNIDRYPIQQFHDYCTEVTIEQSLLDKLDNFDYLYVGFNLNQNQIEKISSGLECKGFSLYLSNENYSVWQKNE